MNARNTPKHNKNQIDEASMESFPASDPPSFASPTAPAQEPAPGGPQSGARIESSRRNVDLNTAPEDLLGSLPALSPERVRTILVRRPFRDWQEIAALPGFDERTVADLKRGGARL